MSRVGSIDRQHRVLDVVLILSLGAIVLAALPQDAEAAKRKPKPKPMVVEQNYTAVGGGGAAPADVCLQALPQQTACFGFTARRSDKYVSIVAKDDSELPVPGYVKIVVSETETLAHPFCGSTVKPIPLQGHTEVGIVLNDYSADLPCQGIATTGTLIATFSSAARSSSAPHH